MSAPPGKFNLASLTKSLKTHQGPDSPRLSQVVEKSFPDIVGGIKSDGEFIKTPSISTTDSDKFLMIVVI